MTHPLQSRFAYILWRVLAGCLFLSLLASCTTPLYDPSGRTEPPKPYTYAVRPVVAVMDFENRSNFAGQWNLGNGMAEVLVTEFLDSERVTVLERKHLDDVISEIFRQGKDLFRQEGKVQTGRLKNARYLIRGAITDFSVVGDSSGWFGAKDGSGLRGGGSKSRVALHIMVSDVETGEIISSVKTADTASKGCSPPPWTTSMFLSAATLSSGRLSARRRRKQSVKPLRRSCEISLRNTGRRALLKAVRT
ncbi:MAG: CsgG/HfaB family protein [Verrucomicrobia bacterium]|nr:CsgG/HfaB family protein [Verrucomicrobiota bacterium]